MGGPADGGTPPALLSSPENEAILDASVIHKAAYRTRQNFRLKTWMVGARWLFSVLARCLKRIGRRSKNMVTKRGTLVFEVYTASI